MKNSIKIKKLYREYRECHKEYAEDYQERIAKVINDAATEVGATAGAVNTLGELVEALQSDTVRYYTARVKLQSRRAWATYQRDVAGMTIWLLDTIDELANGRNGKRTLIEFMDNCELGESDGATVLVYGSDETDNGQNTTRRNSSI